MIANVMRGPTVRRRPGVRAPLRRAFVFFVLAVAAVIGALPVAAGGSPNSLIGLEATYDVSATLHWTAKQLDVTSTATITNNSDTAVGALLFNAAPASIGNMVLGSVTAGAEPATATVDDQNITVTLPTPLQPTDQVAVTINYSAWFGKTGNKQFLFAKVNGIATAYRWIPWLSRAYPFRTPTYGEPFVTKTAAIVTVSITTDQPMGVAATGHRTGVDRLTQTFEAHDVRDFNFAASPKYVETTQAWGDVTITYFLVDLPYSKVQKWTLVALNRFSDRVGPYPYGDYVVAEVPTGPSMESPGMIWLTEHALARGTLKYLAIHETAHQWFYGILGNDQASEPFADEALAEFLTRDLIGHRASACAEDVLDGSVYSYSKECYYETIYVQGDNYLEAYRQRVGNDPFWQGIRNYYTDFKFGLGGTRQLLDTLDAAANGLGGGHEARFPNLYP
jgi:hypothetical protein